MSDGEVRPSFILLWQSVKVSVDCCVPKKSCGVHRHSRRGHLASQRAGGLCGVCGLIDLYQTVGIHQLRRICPPYFKSI